MREIRLKCQLKDEQVERRRIRAEEKSRRENQSALGQSNRLRLHQIKEESYQEHPNLLQSRDDLMMAVSRFVLSENSRGQLSQELKSKCWQFVMENRLGADLRPLGRIQGPFKAETPLYNYRDVIFVFNHQLR
jgi:uncharacterized protein YigA (DUF484 family)